MSFAFAVCFYVSMYVVLLSNTFCKHFFDMTQHFKSAYYQSDFHILEIISVFNHESNFLKASLLWHIQNMLSCLQVSEEGRNILAVKSFIYQADKYEVGEVLCHLRGHCLNLFLLFVKLGTNNLKLRYLPTQKSVLLYCVFWNFFRTSVHWLCGYEDFIIGKYPRRGIISYTLFLANLELT